MKTGHGQVFLLPTHINLQTYISCLLGVKCKYHIDKFQFHAWRHVTRCLAEGGAAQQKKINVDFSWKFCVQNFQTGF